MLTDHYISSLRKESLSVMQITLWQVDSGPLYENLQDMSTGELTQKL